MMRVAARKMTAAQTDVAPLQTFGNSKTFVVSKELAGPP